MSRSSIQGHIADARKIDAPTSLSDESAATPLSRDDVQPASQPASQPDDPGSMGKSPSHAVSPPLAPPLARPLPRPLDHPLPRHVAIIMDGNGRWAHARGLARKNGHLRGIAVARKIIVHCQECGIEYLTLYGFSRDNWSRPAHEVSYLFSLLRQFIARDLAQLHEAGIRIRFIGEKSGLGDELCAGIQHAEDMTRYNTGLNLTIAFNYSARGELIRACRALCVDAQSGQLDPEQISDSQITGRLDTRDVPDPDLIVRTGGEQRLSDFLLWQAAYSEFYFADIHWPDFDEASFDEAIEEYRRRERKFGGLTVIGV